MRVLAYILIFLLVIIAITLRPIDRSPISDEPFYTEMMDNASDFELTKLTDKNKPLQVGWSAVNITPSQPELLIGYKPRGPYETIHDSLFVRSMVIDNGQSEVAIISIDMLLFPPALVEYLEDEFPSINFNISNAYFTATHTHTSIGGWLDSFAGHFIAGDFDTERIKWLGDNILESVKLARKNKSAASIGFQKIETEGLMEHRLDKPSEDIDEALRIITVKKANGEYGIWVTFAAHPSLVNKNTLVLSGDYPNAILKELTAGGIDFAMFSAGMVGSHRPKEYGLFDIPFVEDYGQKLARIILEEFDTENLDSLASISIQKLPLVLPKSQMRLTREIGVRNWIFNLVMGELEGDMKILQIGDILMLGMPCDFSGELSVNGQFDEIASANGHHLIITSFNGDYIGYITDDSRYDTSIKDEVRSLNWVGPHMGEYFTKVIREIID